MTEHDRRILAPKSKAVKNDPHRTAWGRAHTWCQACGAGDYGFHTLTTHEIIGGHGGRSQEPCNYLRLGMHACHDLATLLDVRAERCERCRDCVYLASSHVNPLCPRFHGIRGLLPKFTIPITLSMKLRAGELDNEGFARLEQLHGRTLPDPEPIPELFVRLYDHHQMMRAKGVAV